MTGSAVAGSTEAFAFPGERPVTPEVVREHNLNELEYERILELLGRKPTLTELGVFSALDVPERKGPTWSRRDGV